MVKVGDIYWTAETRGVGDAQEQAGGLQESFDGAAESAIGTAAAQETMGDATAESTEKVEKNERWTRKAKVASGLLSSALYFLTGNFSMATAASVAYSGAVGLATTATTYLTGAVGTLYAAVAGPAGIAAGLALATIGVGLLGSELLGLTDVTPVAQAEAGTITSTFADMAYMIGGPLVGFIGAALLALTGDFEGAKTMVVNTSAEWLKAMIRFGVKAVSGFEVMWSGIKYAFDSGIQAIDYTWRSGLNSLIGVTNSMTQGIADGVVGGMESAMNGAVDVINGLIDKANKVPGVDINGVGGVSIQSPDVPEIGEVANEDLSSRMSAAESRFESNLQDTQQRANAALEQYAPDTMGADRGTSGLNQRGQNLTRDGGRQGRELSRASSGGASAPGDSGGGTEVQEQNVNVEINAEGEGFENMNRSEQKRLAKLIGNELGGQTGDLAGVR